MSEIVQRLFLNIAPDPALLEALEPLLENPLIACALIAPAQGQAMPPASELATMVATLQRADIAVLFTEPDLVAATGADGLHALMGKDGDLGAMEQALRTMKPDRIVGIGGLFTRHGAMTAGESEADYVMFGEPGPQGQTPSFAETLDMASWWSDVFTVPCVAHATEIEKIGIIAASGCDFVALRLEAGSPADAVRSAIEHATHALQVTV